VDESPFTIEIHLVSVASFVMNSCAHEMLCHIGLALLVSVRIGRALLK
jgi:hypothetical protein